MRWFKILLIIVLAAIVAFDVVLVTFDVGIFKDNFEIEEEEDKKTRLELQQVQRRTREKEEEIEETAFSALGEALVPDVVEDHAPSGDSSEKREEVDADPGPHRLTSSVSLPTGHTHTATQRAIGFDVGKRMHFSPWEMRMPIHPEADAALMNQTYSEKWYTKTGDGRFSVGGPSIEVSIQPKLYRQVRMPQRDALLCGPESPENLTLAAATSKPEAFIVPLNVPMGGWWDHFQDGVLPKLVMLLPWARGATVVTDAWNKTMVKNIWELGKLFGVNVTTEFPQVRTSVNILWGCRFPSLHPRQFVSMRKLVLFQLKLPDNRIQDTKHCAVFYGLRNSQTASKGRYLSNEKEVTQTLLEIFPGRLWVYRYSDREPLITILKRMSTVCLGIGPHGSALHNFLYATKDAPLVEITDGQGTTNTHQQVAVMLGRIVGAVGYVGSPYTNGQGGTPVSITALVDVMRAIANRHPHLSNATWARWPDRPSQTPLLGVGAPVS